MKHGLFQPKVDRKSIHQLKSVGFEGETNSPPWQERHSEV